jgi:hypothetical protein
MSIAAVNWAIRAAPVTNKSDLLVLVVLALHADGVGDAFPSVPTIANLSRLSERGVYDALRRLKAAGVISATETPGRHSVYRIHTPANGAGVQTVQGTPAAAAAHPCTACSEPLQLVHPKSKEPSRNHHRKKSPGAQDELAKATTASLGIVDKLGAQILSRDPRARIEPRSERWLREIRLLQDQDGRSVEQIVAVLDWLPTDSFWPAVILSAPKLREKFTELVAAMAKKPSGRSSSDHDETKARRAAALRQAMRQAKGDRGIWS